MYGVVLIGTTILAGAPSVTAAQTQARPAFPPLEL
jgi:hypothetical protein